MRLKGILLTLVVLLGILFAVVNWATLTQDVPVNLLVATVFVPLGLTLLVLAVGLSAAFFILSLLDRAAQLQQLSQLDRHLSTASSKLEKRRLEELEQLEGHLLARLDELTARSSENAERQLAATREHLDAFASAQQSQLQDLGERITLVRDELAADIAKTEDALRGRREGWDANDLG